jgi:two-component system NtrC family sensor kinase
MERHHAIGQMAAALAHDFNNVLDTIGQAVAVLELSEDPPTAERREVLGMIRNAVRRGAEIIAGVREYMRTGTGEKGPVDIRQVLIETIELTRPLWQRAKVRLVTELQPVQMVRGNAADLRRVFANLIINAIEAMPRGGELAISCSERKERVIAEVRDTGLGIPREHQKKIFFPYFTTKPQGTGLGLSGAQKIVLSQGGNIRFRSEPGKGTQFTVELPIHSERQQKHSPAA